MILLVGNKKDLEEEREVTFLEASKFAQENGLMFLETSAKTGQCVEEAFLKCSKNILAKIETGELDPERIGSGRTSHPSLCELSTKFRRSFYFDLRRPLPYKGLPIVVSLHFRILLYTLF